MTPFEYLRPNSLAEAVTAAALPGTAILAGGTNLLDLMKLQIETPRTLLDVLGAAAAAHADYVAELGALGCAVTACSGDVTAADDVRRAAAAARRPVGGVLQAAMVVSSIRSSLVSLPA